ncbi:MAG: SLC13 family permease [Candidatus Nitrosocaldus sp.]|nr:SLC13 family permease [Candidatus Nitrosocaldus sp.]MDW8275287.1 SLC13 family permease [Candidatus Nitrosocaldus sp.]
MTLVYALITFLLVYGLIAVRKVGGITIPAWIPMLVGALVMLAMQVVSVEEAYRAIKMDVILFLLGMFMMVAVLERAGMIQHITVSILRRAGSTDRLLLFILVVMGTLSAFLMNDTIALVATPIILGMSRFGVRPRPLLIALAFAVTIGSAMTPIGNPQNFLIAVESGMRAPMLDFLKYLVLPTLANYIATYYLLRWYYRRALNPTTSTGDTSNTNANTSNGAGASDANTLHADVYDRGMARVSMIVVSTVILAFFALSIARAVGVEPMLDMSHVALAGGSVLLAFSRDRVRVLRHVNWGIILLFVGMFVFMDALTKAGVITMFASLLSPLQLNGMDSNAQSSTGMHSILTIVATSTFLSQFMSNVPFVAFYINVMHEHGFSSDDIKAWVALAGASTLAGNLTILGAASNLIILEAARKEGFTFMEFFRIGSMVTAVNMLILVGFLLIIP